jgi:putative nucleotidyltransferase with HDIG domain
MTQSDFAPQTLIAAAPPDALMAAIVSARNSSRLGSALSLQRIEDASGRILVRFTATEVTDPDPVIKEILPDPPDHVRYRHIAGPYVGTSEEIRLMPVDGGTAVTLTGRFSREDGTARLIRHFLEEGAREYLADLQHIAERWTNNLEQHSLASALVSPPEMKSEEEALGAAREQERREWGHVGHGQGVARVALALAEHLGLPERQVEDVRQASLLHDVGKVALDSRLWGSLRILDFEQRKHMEAHARLGVDLTRRLGLREQILTIMLHHHERWDGRGYPGRLAGNAIPLQARLVGLAESVDTMMRPTYRREGLPTERVILSLQRGASREWDPVLARYMVGMLESGFAS